MPYCEDRARISEELDLSSEEVGRSLPRPCEEENNNNLPGKKVRKYNTGAASTALTWEQQLVCIVTSEPSWFTKVGTRVV